MAGYSSTPLTKKLGLKAEFKIKIINPPDDYEPAISFKKNRVNNDNSIVNFIQVFLMRKAELQNQLPVLKQQIQKDGMIWISWPKKSAKMDTDLNENIVREAALNNGLVDVKVCAIDDTWSGLKLVYRIKDRVQN